MHGARGVFTASPGASMHSSNQAPCHSVHSESTKATCDPRRQKRASWVVYVFREPETPHPPQERPLKDRSRSGLCRLGPSLAQASQSAGQVGLSSEVGRPNMDGPSRSGLTLSLLFLGLPNISFFVSLSLHKFFFVSSEGGLLVE